jgi:hypothetical protein
MKTSPKKEAQKRLTYASQRNNMLASVMIKITYKGKVIECSDAAETIEVLKYMDAEEKKRLIHQVKSPLAEMIDAATFATSAISTNVESPWTRELFWRFIESLGDSQQKVLGLLVGKRKVTDEELRKVLKLDGNQALAGVLSGISKQAGILNISARSVYTVENERKAGTLSKTYVAANEFMRIANEMNWPDE